MLEHSDDRCPKCAHSCQPTCHAAMRLRLHCCHAADKLVYSKHDFDLDVPNEVS